MRSVRSCDGYEWSKPIQLTKEEGANTVIYPL